MSRWWRAYDEAVDDPKLGLLTDRQHRAWFNLVCISSQNGGALPAMPAVAFKLKLSIDKARSLVAELVALKLFDIDPETRVCAPHNWKGRQFQSDRDTTATERKRRQRDKENVTRDVTHMSRPPEAEAEAEAEAENRTDNSEPIGSGAIAPDHRKRLFDEGLKKLATMTGKGPDACRAFVGKCLKAASDDAVTVLGLIEDAERNQAIDPSAWIVARLKPTEFSNAKTNPPQNALGGFSGLAAQLRRKIADDERRAAEAASRDGSLPGF